jgi:hypothetical protein
MPSSWTLRLVDFVSTDVSEERSASIIRESLLTCQNMFSTLVLRVVIYISNLKAKMNMLTKASSDKLQN